MTLCTTITTTPTVIPEGKHYVSYHESIWFTTNSRTFNTGYQIVYRCLNGSCQPWVNSTYVNYTDYSDVSDSCLTVNNVSEKEESYFLTHLIAPEDRILQEATFITTYFNVIEINDSQSMYVCVFVCDA